MDALKAAIGAKRKQAQEELGGRKFAKRSQIENARLTQLREQEHQERAEQEARRAAKLVARGSGDLPSLDSGARMGSEDMLPNEEVVRRLRLLGQPATLFGEEDIARGMRLHQAQDDYQIDDETLGGQQANSLLELIKSGALKRKAPAQNKKANAAADKAVAEAAKAREQQAATAVGEEGAEHIAEAPNSDTAAVFKAAAMRLKAQREEEQMPIEDKIAKWFKQWSAEWQADMDARTEEVKDSSSGYVGTVQFEQTMAFFKALYKQLKHRQVAPDMKAGLWMICQACQERNYLHAYDIYMRLAIGNSPWPIGVTSIGIHDRTSREKISHVMNGAAHVMNDEATRKYLQAVKRLMTFLQRAHPTDPSRGVDFDAYRDPGRGAAGSGSEKAALVEAEGKGETWKVLGLPAAPHLIGVDGEVRVPDRWENLIRGSEGYKEYVQQQKAAKTTARAAKSPNRTPPRSPISC